MNQQIPIESSALRIPPHSEEAERGILGSILLNPHDSLDKCATKDVSPEAFYNRRHSVLYEQMLNMRHTDMPMDAITIGEWLKDKNCLDRIGGYDFLIEIQSDVIVPDHVEHYCDILTEEYRRRSIIAKASVAMDRGYNRDDSDEIIADLTTKLVGDRPREIKTTTTGDIVQAYWSAANGNSRCIPTPFDGLTMRTGGPMRGMETILTGRSKSGKSMFKSFWQRYLGERGIPTLDCPYEDGEFIAKSRCASIGSYNAGRLIRGGSYIRYNDEWSWSKVRAEEIELAQRKLEDLDKLPLYWDEERVTADRLKSKLAYYVKKHGVQVVFLDGVKDILRPDGGYNDTGCEEAISHAITTTARELDIALISVYHLTKLAQDELIKSTNVRGSGNIISNSRLVYALQGDKSGESLESYSDSRPLEFNADGYCESRVLECIDNNHGDLGKTWLNTDLGLCAFRTL